MIGICKEASVVIDYTNHRGVRSERLIQPRDIFRGESPFHEGKQWLLNAFDIERQAWRTFAMKDIHSWRPA